MENDAVDYHSDDAKAMLTLKPHRLWHKTDWRAVEFAVIKVQMNCGNETAVFPRFAGITVQKHLAQTSIVLRAELNETKRM